MRVDRKTQQVELLINDICIGVPLNMVTLLLNTQKTDIFGENILMGDLVEDGSDSLPLEWSKDGMDFMPKA